MILETYKAGNGDKWVVHIFPDTMLFNARRAEAPPEPIVWIDDRETGGFAAYADLIEEIEERAQEAIAPTHEAGHDHHALSEKIEAGINDIRDALIKADEDADAWRSATDVRLDTIERRTATTMARLADIGKIEKETRQMLGTIHDDIVRLESRLDRIERELVIKRAVDWHDRAGNERGDKAHDSDR